MNLVIIVLLIILIWIFYRSNKLEFVENKDDIPYSLKHELQNYHNGLLKKEIIFKTSYKFNLLNGLTLTDFYIKHFLKNKDDIPYSLKHELQNYHNGLLKKEIIFKTSNKFNLLNNDLTLTDFYIKHFLPFTSLEKKTIKLYVDYINSKSSKYPCISSTQWRFIKFSNILEKYMPFTLGQYIFLPEFFLDKMDKNINSSNFLNNCETLLHEKFHIIQRNHQHEFNELYPKVFGCQHIKNLKLNHYWKSKHLSNPDGLDINWIYQFNNSYYLPILTFNLEKRNIESIGIKLKKTKKGFYTLNSYIKLRDIDQLRDYRKHISLYHPNEIMACVLADIILKNIFPKNKKINKLIDFVKKI